MPGAGALTLPAAKFGDLVVELVLKDGKGTFEKLGASGGDVELTGEGLYFAWQPRLEFAPLFGRARLKLAPAFASKPENRGFASLLDAALAGARAGDGDLRAPGVREPRSPPGACGGGGGALKSLARPVPE